MNFFVKCLLTLKGHFVILNLDLSLTKVIFYYVDVELVDKFIYEMTLAS